MSTATTPPPAAPRRSTPAMQIFARRLVGHSSVYVFAGVLGFGAMIAQVVLLTRLIPHSQYGALAVLILYSSFVGIVCGLAVTQGTVIAAFLGGDEEGMTEEPEAKDEKPVTDNRGLLTTGMLTTMITTTVVTGLALAFAAPFSDLLTGSRGNAAALVWMTAYGGLGTTYRMLLAIPRFERRPVSFLCMSIGDDIISLGIAAALASRYGLPGIAAGLFLGRLLAIVIGVTVSRHRFRPTYKLDLLRRVVARGWPYAGVVLSFFLSRHAELFVLSHYVTGNDVGTYQVAARLAMIPGFALMATLLAWGPIVRGPIRAELEKQDKLPAARARLVTYYVMLSTWVIVAATLLGEVLVQIAPAGYADAARMLPLLTVASTLHAATTLIFRMTMIKGGLKRYRRWAVTSVPLLVGGAILVVPAYGSIGAAAVNAAVPLIGLTFIYWSSLKGKAPLQLSRRRILGVFLVAAACIAGGRLALLLPSTERVAAELALVAVFPLALLLTGLFPRREVRQLLGLLRPSDPHKVRRGDVRERLRLVAEQDLRVLEALIRHDRRPHEVAKELEVSEDHVCGRMVAALRTVSDTGEESKVDAKIGRTLTIRTAQTMRDFRGWQLSQDPNVKPLEVDRLTQAMKQLGKLPARAWDEALTAVAGERQDASVSEQPGKRDAAPGIHYGRVTP